MQFDGSWGMNYFRQFADGIPWDIAPTPIGLSDRVYRGPGSDGLVIASTEHPMEAWRLVRFFLEEFVQFDKANSRLEVPIMRQAVASDVYLSPPPQSMLVINDLLERSIPQPVFYGTLDVLGVINQQISAALAGQVPVETAVAEAQRLGQAKLNEFLTSE